MRGFVVENYFVDLKGKRKVIFTFTILGIFGLMLIITPIAHAEPTIGLSSTQGPVDAMISVTGLGFETGTVYVKFDGKTVGRTSSGMFGRINVAFQVPKVPLGSYTITVEGSAGSKSTATFTVTYSTSTSTPSSTGSSSATLWLNPVQGSEGTGISVSGSGFSSGGPVSISFDSKSVASTSADAFGAITTFFAVPSASIGAHIVTATGVGGIHASATFAVAQKSSGGVIASSPTQSSEVNANFWSPLMIVAVLLLVAISAIIPLILVNRRRGEQEGPLDEAPPAYGPPPAYRPGLSPMRKNSVAISKANQYYPGSSKYPRSIDSRINLSSKMYSSPEQRSTSSKYSPQPANTKICRHCKQIVRDDYNVCPYCRKRLR